MNLFEMDQAVFGIIRDVAEKFKPCPTSAAIGQAIGVSDKPVRLSLRRLENDGKISITPQHGCRRRVIHIVGMEISTAPEILKVGEKIEPRAVKPAASIFDDAMRRCRGRFEDAPNACRPMARMRTLPPPTLVLRDPRIGIAGSAHRGGARAQ